MIAAAGYCISRRPRPAAQCSLCLCTLFARCPFSPTNCSRNFRLPIAKLAQWVLDFEGSHVPPGACFASAAATAPGLLSVFVCVFMCVYPGPCPSAHATWLAIAPLESAISLRQSLCSFEQFMARRTLVTAFRRASCSHSSDVPHPTPHSPDAVWSLVSLQGALLWVSAPGDANGRAGRC